MNNFFCLKEGGLVAFNKLWLYLVLEKKFKDSAKNKQKMQSRFRYFDQFFCQASIKREFTRENFSQLILFHKERGLSPATLNNIIKLGKLIDKYLGTNCLQDYTFFKGADRVKEFDPLSDLDITRLLKAGDSIYVEKGKEERRLFYNAIILVLQCSGMRVGELLNLKWSDLRQVEGIKTAFISDTKSQKPRTVVLSETAWEAVQGLDRKNDRIFPISEQSLKKDLIRRSNYAQLNKPVYPHLFRHSLASALVLAGAPLPFVQSQLGHQSISTTVDQYVHTNLVQLYNSLNTFHPAFKKEQSFDSLTKRIKDTLLQMIDDKSYQLSVEHEVNSLTVKIAVKGDQEANFFGSEMPPI